MRLLRILAVRLLRIAVRLLRNFPVRLLRILAVRLLRILVVLPSGGGGRWCGIHISCPQRIREQEMGGNGPEGAATIYCDPARSLVYGIYFPFFSCCYNICMTIIAGEVQGSDRWSGSDPRSQPCIHIVILTRMMSYCLSLDYWTILRRPR